MKTLQVRVPDELRADADSVLGEIGLDMPTAIRLYLNKIVQTRSIPFDLRADSTGSPHAGGAVVEEVDVDAVTQAKMDAVGELLRKARS